MIRPWSRQLSEASLARLEPRETSAQAPHAMRGRRLRPSGSRGETAYGRDFACGADASRSSKAKRAARHHVEPEAANLAHAENRGGRADAESQGRNAKAAAPLGARAFSAQGRLITTDRTAMAGQSADGWRRFARLCPAIPDLHPSRYTAPRWLWTNRHS